MDESKSLIYFSNFAKICRLCLTQSIDIISIFSQSNQDCFSLKSRIKDCVTVEVMENDGLPQNICCECMQKINDWHDFKNHCQKSDVTLRSHLMLKTLQHDNQIANQHDGCDMYNKDMKPDKSNCNEDVYSGIDFQESNTHLDELFSESDEKPLIEVNTDFKRKKNEKNNKRNKKSGKKEASKPLKRGRTPKKNEKNNKRNKKSGKKEASKPLTRGRTPKAKPLCLVCHQKFSRFVELIDHQNKVHNLNMNVDVDNENALEELKMNIDAFAVFKCHICKEEFSGREDLRNHCKTIHNTKVIQPYPCSHCDRQFPSWGLLVVHERKHTGEKPYSCDICGKQNFISLTSLRRHKLIHLKVYNCKECGRDFNCDSALKGHIRCKHTKEKPFLCNICGRNFSLSAILMAHMTSHSSERKYICDICGFASKTSGNHYRHKNTHKTGGIKSFHCENCGKSFDSKLKLSSHQIIHRPSRPHVCKVCGKAFLYKNKLERHILLVHARERPFPCTLCGKKLASKFGLGIHLKTHNRNDNPKIEGLC